MTVGQLNVALGLLVNKAEWQKGEAYINHFRRIALTFGAVFGGRMLGTALIGFNKDIENAKNQIASLLALGGQTTLVSQLGRADTLYDMLRTKAAALPGQTEDYVNMLSMIAQPMSAANMSLEQMRDITAGAFVWTKALGRQWQASGRDLSDFINFGKINKTDYFLRTLLTGTGIDATPEGRQKAQSMTMRQRAELIHSKTTDARTQEVSERLGASFEGRWETVVDTVRLTMAKAGEALFNSLKGTITDITSWLIANKDVITSWATTVGHSIAAAFIGLKNGILWLAAHQDLLVSFLVSIGGYLLFVAVRAIGAWLAVAWPMFAGAGLFYVFTKLYEALGPIPTILIGIAAAAVVMWLGLLGPGWILIILAGLIVAAFYVFRDEIGGVFDWIGDKIDWVIEKLKNFWDMLSKSPVDAMSGMLTQQGFQRGISDGSRAVSAQNVARDLAATGAPAAAQPGTVQVNAPAQINITTRDAKSAADAFLKADSERMDNAARAAKRNLGGNR